MIVVCTDSNTVGGALATWNQPIEVVRVEMQSMSKNISKNRPEKLTVFNTLGFIYKENGMKGLYRGVTPRIGLGIWQTVCMVSFADYVKAWYDLSPTSLVMVLTRLQGQGVSLEQRAKLYIEPRGAWCLLAELALLLYFLSIVIAA